MYKIHERDKARKDFQRVFNAPIGQFYDGLISVVFKHICIDPFKFDFWLHKRHGEYEDAGKSMQDILMEHYGQEGIDLLTN